MYRVQHTNPKEWVFVCKECLIDVKKENPNYKYGVLGRNKFKVNSCRKKSITQQPSYSNS